MYLITYVTGMKNLDKCEVRAFT